MGSSNEKRSFCYFVLTNWKGVGVTAHNNQHFNKALTASAAGSATSEFHDSTHLSPRLSASRDKPGSASSQLAFVSWARKKIECF